MMDDLLSQDEINALLAGDPIGGGSDDASSDAPAGGGEGASLSSAAQQALKDVCDTFSKSLGSVFGMLTGKDVRVAVIAPKTITQTDLTAEAGEAFVLRATTSGLNDAKIAMVLPQIGAQTLSDMMMGGEGKDLSGEMTDLDISAAQEGVSQVFGSAFTALSGKLAGSRLVPENVTAVIEKNGEWKVFADSAEEICYTKIIVTVDGVVDFDAWFACTVSGINDFAEAFEKAQAAAPAAPEPAADKKAGASPQMNMGPAPQPQYGPAPQYDAPSVHGMQQPGPMVDVRPAEFAPLTSRGSSAGTSRIDLVADIPVRVTVELGRTRKNISEILNMYPGSVIELDKMAGEPVDILVNGKLIAKGEVVVIDENFGVRVTEIVSVVSKAYPN